MNECTWITNTLMKEIATLLIEDDIDVMSLIGLWWYALVITHNWFQDWSVMHCIVWVFNVFKRYKRNCGKNWQSMETVPAQCTFTCTLSSGQKPISRIRQCFWGLVEPLCVCREISQLTQIQLNRQQWDLLQHLMCYTLALRWLT